MARGDSQAHGNEGVQGEGSREGPEKLNWAWGGELVRARDVREK